MLVHQRVRLTMTYSDLITRSRRLSELEKCPVLQHASLIQFWGLIRHSAKTLGRACINVFTRSNGTTLIARSSLSSGPNGTYWDLVFRVLLVFCSRGFHPMSPWCWLGSECRLVGTHPVLHFLQQRYLPSCHHGSCHITSQSRHGTLIAGNVAAACGAHGRLEAAWWCPKNVYSIGDHHPKCVRLCHDWIYWISYRKCDKSYRQFWFECLSALSIMSGESSHCFVSKFGSALQQPPN